MVGRNYHGAFESYQQAIYRDDRNPAFWNACGELYYNVNQFRDALDMYSRGIRIDPYISELWFNLGRLYEVQSNGGNTSKAVKSYSRARELDPFNSAISQRLKLLTDRLDRQQPGIDDGAASSVSAARIDTEEEDEDGGSDNDYDREVVYNEDEDYDDSIGEDNHNLEHTNVPRMRVMSVPSRDLAV